MPRVAARKLSNVQRIETPKPLFHSEGELHVKYRSWFTTDIPDPLLLQVTLEMSSSLTLRECPDPPGYISTTLDVIQVRGVQLNQTRGVKGTLNG